MNIQKIENPIFHGCEQVRIKEMGNIIELMYSEHKSSKCSIKRIDANTYIDLRDGEVKEFKHIENRACDLNEVRKSLGRLRDYINTNVEDVRRCKWVTLTYKENMRDTGRLYKDFEKFVKRARYKLGHFEYIVAMEPQGRGSWHSHILMIFDRVVEKIDNDKVMYPLWGYGWTKTKRLDNLDNVGAYLTAYLGDMEWDEVKESSIQDINYMRDRGCVIRDIEVDGVSKSIVKGARLQFYPPKFNIYRCSRGIKKPIITYDSEMAAQKKVSAGTLTFERTIHIQDEENSFENTINYRYYNRVRVKNQ